MGLEKSEHVPGTLSVTNKPLWIGSEGTKKIFDGFIDEVMVFDRALTATQVEWLVIVGTVSLVTAFPVKGSVFLMTLIGGVLAVIGRFLPPLLILAIRTKILHQKLWMAYFNLLLQKNGRQAVSH
ncbi:MAG: hypothetical protein B6I37_09235 [Desulfobacteraceae bacterium 4572_35.2]|nr:MAG: hypothetical protein B6I37_09235 [Desulfobacteraceae bacterium 4572_35.2]